MREGADNIIYYISLTGDAWKYGYRHVHDNIHYIRVALYTNQQLLLLIDRIHQSLNSNVSCNVLYLDFRKAFDRVPHNELL